MKDSGKTPIRATGDLPERIYAEQDAETNTKRWYSTKGMGVEYVRVDQMQAALDGALSLLRRHLSVEGIASRASTPELFQDTEVFLAKHNG